MERHHQRQDAGDAGNRHDAQRHPAALRRALFLLPVVEGGPACADQVVLVLDAAAVGVESCALYVLAVFLLVEEEGVNAQHQN